MSVQFASGDSSRPSMAELASFASRAQEISVGGGDDIVELGDDLGVNLLSNPNKVSASPKSARQVNFSSGGSSGSGEMPHISIKPVEDLEVVNLDAAPGQADVRINRDAEPAPFVINMGSSSEGGEGSPGSPAVAAMTAEEEAREKQKYLTKLRRLESNDIRGARMTMSNSLDEIKAEHDKLTDSRNLEASIRFQRNALMTFVTGVEMVNDKFGSKLPIKPRLKGWSESVHTNIEDFDEIFEELYDLYKDQAKVHPMLRLVGTLGVSATMYHLTNSMAERSGIPGMADLLNENPELQRQFAQAAAAKMGGLGQFMSAAGGFNGPSRAAPSPAGAGAPPPSPPRAAETRVPFNAASSASVPEGPRIRREMRGPSGVDDILKAFEAERHMQHNPVASGQAGVFTPAGPPPSPPRRMQILREGVGSSVDPMAEFLMGSDDGSVGSGGTMNTERRRGRRRAAAEPVGSTLNINV
jgi:hypothetical protein